MSDHNPTLTPVYVAAPFAGDVAENVRRAAALSRLAVERGHAPICVHPAIAAGCYGDDAVPEERERGLQAVCRLVEVVAWHGGELWVLLRDDGTMSAGVTREVEAWLDAGGRPYAVVRWRWVDGAPLEAP